MKKIKILAVCGFGIGSSLILKMNIEKMLKENNIEAEVTNTDIVTAETISCDLIATSEGFKRELEGKVKAPLVSIDKFFSKEELNEKLMGKIKELI